ncbi:MAG TPA: carboxypeptidase-like regulatory domain-containing protein [Pantanalinema sp.]
MTSPPPVTGPTPPYPYATPAPPEVGAREVAGTVLTRGEPASGIPLTVINNRTGRTYRLTTDASGIYRVKDVPDGQYYAHFYNDSDNNRVGFWRTRTVQVTASHGGVFPAWDVYLVGMRNSPGQGQSVSFPFTARFEPYPLAITYRFRIHDRGGPGGQALFISELIPAKGLRTFTFDGASNQGSQGAQSVAALGSGRYLWGYQWDSGMAGEGGCLFQDFSAGR